MSELSLGIDYMEAADQMVLMEKWVWKTRGHVSANMLKKIMLRPIHLFLIMGGQSFYTGRPGYPTSLSIKVASDIKVIIT